MFTNVNKIAYNEVKLVTILVNPKREDNHKKRPGMLADILIKHKLHDVVLGFSYLVFGNTLNKRFFGRTTWLADWVVLLFLALLSQLQRFLA
jgi:hypothetical protein